MSTEFFDKTEIHYTSNDGKTDICAYKYIPILPDGEKYKGIIQVSHGMCEYIGRYEEFFAYMCKNGFICCGNDHIGHGNSANGKTTLGFTAEGGGADILVDDLYTLTGIMKNEYPDLPYTLLGHSMGSFVAREYMVRYGDKIDAVILSGTGGPDSPTGFGKFMAKMKMFFSGEKSYSKFIIKCASAGYLKKYEKGAHPKSWITSDKEKLEKYINDPLCSFEFTARAYYDMFDLLGRVSKPAWAKKVPNKLPVLMISGDMDPVGQFGDGVRKIYSRLVDAGIDVTANIYEGGRHEMLNETNREEVFDDVRGWICEKLL